MKVAYFDLKQSVYGGQYALLQRCVALEEMKHDFEIFHPYANSLFVKEAEKRGLGHRLVGNVSEGRGKLRGLLDLVRYLLRTDADVLHFDSFEAAYVSAALAKMGLVRRKLVFTIRSDRYHRFGWLDKWLLASMDELITNSQYSRGCILAKLPAADVYVNYSPIHFDKISVPATPREDGALTISYVGSIERRKNLIFFVKLANTLMRSGLEARFHIYGDVKSDVDKDYIDEVMALVGEVDAQRFKLLGHREIGSAIASTDILVCPYIDEPMGRVVPEFLYFGRPVIVSDSGGLAEAGMGYAVTYRDGNLDEAAQKVTQAAGALSAGHAPSPEIRNALEARFGSAILAGKDWAVCAGTLTKAS